jgi:benzoyl-CoA reductase/2-hydroxyglutaryl-CoA dehydratase subunit BcrC/BadD/HgdB
MQVEAQVREGENAFERTMGILDLIRKIPDTISDEELEGLAGFVHPGLRNTVLGLFGLRAARSTEIFFIKKMAVMYDQAREAKRTGKKIVFIPFTFPPEIIFAFENLIPISTEVVGGLAVNVCTGQGERYWDFAMSMGLPDSLCSANTITVGSLCMGNTLLPDAIVSNSVGSCDPNAKIHAFAADYLGIPQFILEKPIGGSAREREKYLQYLVALIEDLEEFAGEKLNEDRLRQVMQRVYRAAELYHEIWELKKARPCPVPNIFNLTFIATRAQLWGREEAVDIMRRMVDVSKERLNSGQHDLPDEIVRVYISYIPFLFDFYGLYSWMEQRGIRILGDGIWVQFFPSIDMSCKEGMLKALAEIAFEYPMTRQMGANTMSVRWLEDVCHAVEDLGADCCMYCGHHACKHTEGTLSYFRREMMKRMKKPTLILKGDAFDKRVLPMDLIHQELELFVDKVVARKHKPAARKRRARGSQV